MEWFACGCLIVVLACGFVAAYLTLITVGIAFAIAVGIGVLVVLFIVGLIAHLRR